VYEPVRGHALSDDQIQDTRGVRHLAPTRDVRNAYIILVWDPEGKRTLGRPRSR
jgi:hypothetical protein